MSQARSANRAVRRNVRRSPVDPGNTLTLPRTGLLFLCRDGLHDTIGLSVADYTSVDPSLRSIFYSDATHLRPTADAYAAALASQLINVGTMVGTAGKVVALYTFASTEATLRRAYRYFGLTYSPPTIPTMKQEDGTPWLNEDGTQAYMEG